MTVLLAVVGAALVLALVNQHTDAAPRLAEALVRLGARGLGFKAARYEEEWLADLALVPGRLQKLGYALSVCTLSVVRLRRTIRVPNWEPVDAGLPFATDSIFGKGNPGIYDPAPVRVAWAAPRRKPFESKPEHVCSTRCDWECFWLRSAPPVPVLRTRRAEPVAEPPRFGGDRIHRRRFRYEEDVDIVFGSPRKASPSVIGL